MNFIIVCCYCFLSELVCAKLKEPLLVLLLTDTSGSEKNVFLADQTNLKREC